MNIYEKINEVKLTLQTANIKKSGWNTHSKYAYYELGDFMGVIVPTCEKIKLHTATSFGADLATMTITDIEKPEDQVVVTSPMSTAKLPACHEVQNLGAVQTYLRRYLYAAAFDIAENDALDAGATKKTQDTQTQTPTAGKEYKCEGVVAKDGKDVPCEKKIDFGETTPSAWIKSSKKRFGKTLCMDCINKEKAKGKTASGASGGSNPTGVETSQGSKT